jgi:uncharacterized protein involved in exopolysaccharide biosynthesis
MMMNSSTTFDSTPPRAPAVTQDEVKLKEVFGVLWRGKLLIILVTLATTLAAVAATIVLPRKYQVTVIMLPASDDSGGRSLGGAASAMLSQVGLGSLAGLGGAGGSRKVEAVALLQSQALTRRFVEENNLLPVLFAKKWDAARGRWKSDDPQYVPTLWAANKYFERIRTVEDNKATGLVTLRISWKDPQVAAKWANSLITMTNEYLRNKSIQESERNIAYLNDQASKTGVIEVQRAIYSLLEGEIKKVMLARGSDEYALRVVDPALPPDKPSFPEPGIWIPTGFVLGLFFSIWLAFSRRR